MAQTKQHIIDKFTYDNKQSRYTCNECNTSYPTLKSVKESHPNIELKIIQYTKNGYGGWTPRTEKQNHPVSMEMITQ